MRHAHVFSTGGCAKDPDQYVETSVYQPAPLQASHWSEDIAITIGSVDHITIGWLTAAKAREFAHNLLACVTHAERHIELRERMERHKQRAATAQAGCVKGADCTVTTGYCTGCCS